ncbi:hypothetical protein CBR_g2676 [Chara braunii]|uniref:Uncharacterized protein n=1 Tax=Chara braunii TaxID=69332 RepID=A0A388KDJ8_CHABU|nr:hypothetical protein CBR_g2676 [Chara braunii]|eukprot:GBG68125.1 hypothetical protein CBR_g2676 [Chara braunii]
MSDDPRTDAVIGPPRGEGPVPYLGDGYSHLVGTDFAMQAFRKPLYGDRFLEVSYIYTGGRGRIEILIGATGDITLAEELYLRSVADEEMARCMAYMCKFDPAAPLDISYVVPESIAIRVLNDEVPDMESQTAALTHEGVLDCEVVWVQNDSSLLAKLGKLDMQEMVQLVKCDRVLVRLWNYYRFKHEKRPDLDWIPTYPFLKKKSAIFKEFDNRGLDVDLWDGSRKHVSDSTLFKDCPPYMACDDDQTIEAMEKLVGHKKLSLDWKNKVFSVLTSSRQKSREIALAEGIVHILWKGKGNMTSIALFDNDPLEAEVRSKELQAVVASTKSHMFVLNL